MTKFLKEITLSDLPDNAREKLLARSARRGALLVRLYLTGNTKNRQHQFWFRAEVVEQDTYERKPVHRRPKAVIHHWWWYYEHNCWKWDGREQEIKSHGLVRE